MSREHPDTIQLSRFLLVLQILHAFPFSPAPVLAFVLGTQEFPTYTFSASEGTRPTADPGQRSCQRRIILELSRPTPATDFKLLSTIPPDDCFFWANSEQSASETGWDSIHIWTSFFRCPTVATGFRRYDRAGLQSNPPRTLTQELHSCCLYLSFRRLRRFRISPFVLSADANRFLSQPLNRSEVPRCRISFPNTCGWSTASVLESICFRKIPLFDRKTVPLNCRSVAYKNLKTRNA